MAILKVEPLVGPLDAPIDITIAGARKDAKVRLHAHTTDESGMAWRSTSTLVVEGEDSVRLDGRRLLTSMVGSGGPSPYGKFDASPLRVTLTAEVDGHQIDEIELERFLAGAGVRRAALNLPGVSGAFFHEDGDRPRPAVLVLGGSSGETLESTAALLASHGFAAAAVAYFGSDGLPGTLASIPLEVFVRVLDWMAARPSVRADSIGLVGTSKGGEAALLLASYHPAVRAVVACNGSGFHFQAFSAPGQGAPSWTLRGEALAYLRVEVDMNAAAEATIARPFETVESFRSAMSSAPDAAAETPVERINGPILMLAGEDDRVWPSHDLALRVEARMRRHGREADVEVVSYPDAGHDLGLPNLPASGTVSFRRGLVRALGGTAEGNAAARADAWTRQVDFLRRALAPESST